METEWSNWWSDASVEDLCNKDQGDNCTMLPEHEHDPETSNINI